MMSQHSNSLATATVAILVHNENLLRLCTKMAVVSMAKGCMQMLYNYIAVSFTLSRVLVGIVHPQRACTRVIVVSLSLCLFFIGATG